MVKMKIRINSSKASSDFTGAMTDISFLLIIFFLVTTVFMSAQGILLKLPSVASEPQKLSINEIILIEIISADEYVINRGNTIKKAGLKDAIKSNVDNLPEPVLVLLVSGEITYQNVLDVLEISKSGGINKFSVRYKKNDPRGLQIEESAS